MKSFLAKYIFTIPYSKSIQSKLDNSLTEKENIIKNIGYYLLEGNLEVSTSLMILSESYEQAYNKGEEKKSILSKEFNIENKQIGYTLESY